MDAFHLTIRTFFWATLLSALPSMAEDKPCTDCHITDPTLASDNCAMFYDRVFKDEQGRHFFVPEFKSKDVDIHGVIEADDSGLLKVVGNVQARLKPNRESRRAFRKARRKYPGLKWFTSSPDYSISVGVPNEPKFETSRTRRGKTTVDGELNSFELTLATELIEKAATHSLTLRIRPSPRCDAVDTQFLVPKEFHYKLSERSTDRSCWKKGVARRFDQLTSRYRKASTSAEKKKIGHQAVRLAFAHDDARMKTLVAESGLTKKELREIADSIVDGTDSTISESCTDCSENSRLDRMLDYDIGVMHALHDTVSTFYQRLSQDTGYTNFQTADPLAKWQKRLLEKFCKPAPDGFYVLKAYNQEDPGPQVPPALVKEMNALNAIEKKLEDPSAYVYCAQPRSKRVIDRSWYPWSPGKTSMETHREKIKR